jgi:hypothetical protein
MRERSTRRTLRLRASARLCRLARGSAQHIGRVAIYPKNANVAFVAAIAHLYQAHSDRGVFRTGDAGKTWQKVLFKNNDVGGRSPSS